MRVETPEGVELELRTAGPLPRAFAWLIDISIRGAIHLFLFAVLLTLDRLGYGLFLITLFALEWFYPVLFEVYFGGATPGKRAMGLQVLHDDGTPVALPASTVRNLIRFVDFLPLFYTLGFFSMVLDGRFRRLGDLAGGTFVVYAPSSTPRLGRQGSMRTPPAVRLTRDEQRAVMEFAERAPGLARDRATELASIPTPLVGHSSDPVSRLYAVANHLAGSL